MNSCLKDLVKLGLISQALAIIHPPFLFFNALNLTLEAHMDFKALRPWVLMAITVVSIKSETISSSSQIKMNPK